MTRLHALIALALASCATSEAKPAPGGAADIDVELSSVTLADDCKPPPKRFAQSPDRRDRAAARCAGPSCHRDHCEQTSMQLSIVVPANAASTKLAIKRVELLDAKGRVLEELTPYAGTRWTAKGRYVAWDGSLAAGDTVKASYALAAPSWGKLTKGRHRAHEKRFQLRVTMTLGTASLVVEKKSIAPAMVAPPIVT